MIAQMGADIGPLWVRGLNQAAVSQTFSPGATVAGKTTSAFVRVVIPSNRRAARSLGASGPTKLKIAAPWTPAGLPRRPWSPSRAGGSAPPAR